MSDQLSSDLAALKIDREERPASSAPKYLLWLVILAGIGAAVYFFAVPYLTAKIYKTEVEATAIALVSPAQGSIELSTTGYVQPQTTSKVGARIAGRIEKVLVKEGDNVKTGDLIVVIDDADHRAAINAASARVAAARARAATARAQTEETEILMKRERALVEKGASASSNIEDLDARLRSMRANIVAFDAEVRAAAAEVETLKVNLTYTKVYAPIDGRVIEKPIEVGDAVSPMVASTLVSLADFSTLVVETDVPEGRLGQVKLGSPCEIALDAFPGKRFRGQAIEVASKVDRAKATVGVKVKFVDDNTGALPDMAARVSFLTKELDQASMKEPPRLIVPAAAVADRAGQKFVFVIDAGVVRQVPVVLGASFGDGFELKTGPPAGTKIVKNPAANLADGQNVKEKDS